MPVLVACLALPLWQAAEVNHLINQLGSVTFAQREAASKQLELVGEPALGALRKAAVNHTDLEVRRRAESLDKAITGRDFRRLQGQWKSAIGSGGLDNRPVQFTFRDSE